MQESVTGTFSGGSSVIVTPYECPECGHPFKSRGALDLHISNAHRSKPAQKVQTGTKEKAKVHCEYCDGEFTPGVGMASHIRIEHPDQWIPKNPAKTLACEICRATFQGKTALNRHKKEEHGLKRNQVATVPSLPAKKMEEDDSLHLHFCPKCGMREPRTRYCTECGVHLERITQTMQNLIEKGFLSWY